MNKIYLFFLIIGSSLNCADDGNVFVQLAQKPTEARETYFERIHPLLPTTREYMRGSLDGDFVTYKKGDRIIEILKNDILDAQAYQPDSSNALSEKMDLDI